MVFGRKEGQRKFVKTVLCVHTVYVVIMYCSILTTTVVVSTLSMKWCLGAFVQLRKTIVSVVMSLRPSFCMIKMWQEQQQPCVKTIYGNISLSLFRMRNVSDERYGKTKNTFYVQ